MSDKKISVSYLTKNDEFFVGGDNLRDIRLGEDFYKEDTNIFKDGVKVENIDEFIDIFNLFEKRQPLGFSIEKILCEEVESKLVLRVNRRLKKVHSSYSLTFFFSKYPAMQLIKKMHKEIAEIEATPSLPIPDGETIVDLEKIKVIKAEILETLEEIASKQESMPDINITLPTVKSEYKMSSTLITLSMTPDDVFEILERRIKEVNQTYGLFLKTHNE